VAFGRSFGAAAGTIFKLKPHSDLLSSGGLFPMEFMERFFFKAGWKKVMTPPEAIA